MRRVMSKGPGLKVKNIGPRQVRQVRHVRHAPKGKVRTQGLMDSIRKQLKG